MRLRLPSPPSCDARGWLSGAPLISLLSNQGFGRLPLPTARLSRAFRDRRSGNGSPGWASPYQSYPQRQWGRMGEQSQGDSKVTAGEGAWQTKTGWVSSLSHQPASHQNPVQPGPLPCGHLSTTHLLPFCVPAVKLLRFSLALNNGISCLQVRRICHQGKGDVPVGDAVNPPVVHSQVVLHVTGALTEGREESPPGR